jgi:hypothetical protein
MLLRVKRLARCFCLFFNAMNYEAQSYFQIRRSVHRNIITPHTAFHSQRE